MRPALGHPLSKETLRFDSRVIHPRSRILAEGQKSTCRILSREPDFWYQVSAGKSIGFGEVRHCAREQQSNHTQNQLLPMRLRKQPCAATVQGYERGKILYFLEGRW
eukprot:411743-Pelagomonas_calceolata.AAC.6